MELRMGIRLICIPTQCGHATSSTHFRQRSNYKTTAATRGTVLYHTASLSVEWRALQHGPRPTTGDFGIIDQVRFVYHAAFDASMKNTRAPLIRPLLTRVNLTMPVVPEYAPFNSSRERRGFDAELLSNGACILRCLRALESWLNHREKALRIEFIRSTLNYTDFQTPCTTCVKGDNVGFPNGCFIKTFTGLQCDHHRNSGNH